VSITKADALKLARSHAGDALIFIAEGNERAAAYNAAQCLHYCGLYARMVEAELAQTDLEMREADYAHGAA
jgi:hypothetical protein